MKLETFLDVLLIEEILEENATGSGLRGLDGKEIAAKTDKQVGRPPTGRVISCDTRFPMMGMWVDMPYKVGDIVITNEYGRNYEIALNRERQYQRGVPKFYLIHYADVEGRVTGSVPRGTFEDEYAAQLS
jgi:hypothetical protein